MIHILVSSNIANFRNDKKLSNIILLNVEALASDEGGYSCSASANCYFGSTVEGSVSCTGTKSCESGYEYVKCDGKTSSCS